MITRARARGAASAALADCTRSIPPMPRTTASVASRYSSFATCNGTQTRTRWPQTTALRMSSTAAPTPAFAEPVRPSRSLAGRVALVTGAGAAGEGIGNGRASSILLAEAGATVVCVDRAAGDAERTAAMIEREGGRAASFAADVTDGAQAAAAVEFAARTFGRLDVLVNVVGVIGARGTAVDVDMDEWAQSMQINVASMVLMAKHAVPVLRRNERAGGEGGGCRGAIVNIGSVAGLRGGTPHLLYPTSKGAVVNMTRAMAAHHAEDGIRANCVCPGMLYTPMMYGPGMSDEARAARTQRSMLKTEGNAWDCGAAVRFLASDEARWITGVALPVDAGATASASIELGEKKE